MKNTFNLITEKNPDLKLDKGLEWYFSKQGII